MGISKGPPVMGLIIKTKEKVLKLREFHNQKTKLSHRVDLKELLIIQLIINQAIFKDPSNLGLRAKLK